MYLAGKLKHRFQVLTPTQTPNDAGGFDQEYTIEATIWGELIRPSEFATFVKAVRGEQVNNRFTHYIKLRWLGVKNLGREFSIAFSTGFKNMGDINNIKTQYYLGKLDGSAVKRRLYRVMGSVREERMKEFILLEVKEVEEQGTGWEA